MVKQLATTDGPKWQTLPEKVTNMHYFQPKFQENHFLHKSAKKDILVEKYRKFMRNQKFGFSYVYFYTN